ncbi:MAG TPA: exodeoxyribonuclease V subunit gamma [Xanthomonadales bacterium]|nr:exodeoxyribonuclease V subunit gamma [Xanthomonadales bacterium]
MPDDSNTGLIVYRASRLEALLEPLDTLLRATAPDDPLAPQTVVAAHPGMRHWLLGALARSRGNDGIVANLDVVLPGTWFDDLARRLLGIEAEAAASYRRDCLRWRIHAALDRLPSPRLARYFDVGSSESARRRFRLADRLAGVYSRYLAYRPDWLAAWARDAAAEPHDDVLGPLWHLLRREIGIAHRGERVTALLTALADDAGEAVVEPVHLFGIAHLPPPELAVLRALARHRTVVLYLPDPCREYWGGLLDPRRALREQALREPFSPDAEAWYFEQERSHPLLARWGRLGQHFFMALHDDEGPAIDVRHAADHSESDAMPTDRLARVQESIRRLDPSLLGCPSDQRSDASLRVHVCRTRLRELEVLRDQLLRALADDPGLMPSDIVVMAPDIAAYLPLLPAVFDLPGSAGGFAGRLPYHLADVPLRTLHPLFLAFESLLALPQSRVTAPELLDLAGQPAVRRRFRFDEDDLAEIADWLVEVRAAWALDAEHRSRFEVPALAEHSLAWAMDRLLASHAVGALGDERVDLLSLPDAAVLATIPGIDGPRADLLGRFELLLREVSAVVEGSRMARPASHWVSLWLAHLDALFAIDPHDSVAVDAWRVLRSALAALADETASQGLDPVLEFSVVRDVWLERLASVPDRQHFLLGAITVCGMVPQRAIPFRMIAVLGLNDGEYPRPGGEVALDPMQRLRRIGDRDTRSDDRYLFLETVMAARWRLHLSYLGEGVHDDRPRNPAAPLAELLAALDTAAGIAPDADADVRPWLVYHPLQPFDRRYFRASGGVAGDDESGVRSSPASDPALFSFMQADYRLACPESIQPAPTGAAHAQVFYRPSTVAEADIGVASGTTIEVALRDLLAYYRDPARHVLRDCLRIRLDALEPDRLAEREPLAERFERIDRVGVRVFQHAAEQGLPTAPAEPPIWLAACGLLPPGRPGQQAWQAERQRVDALLASAGQHPVFEEGRLPPAHPVRHAIEIGPWMVIGESGRVRRSSGAEWLFDAFPGKRSESELSFRERIPAFIEWALLRLSMPFERPVRMALLTEQSDAPWQQAIAAWDARQVRSAERDDRPAVAQARAELVERLAALIEFRQQAIVRPHWYFPRTSWRAAVGDRVRVSADFIGDAGSGGDRTFGTRALGERDYPPGYAHLLAGAIDFALGTEARAELDRVAADLWRWIDLADTEDAA